MSRRHWNSQAASQTIRCPTTRPWHEVLARREFPEGGHDILLTTDRDFVHTIPHLFDGHCGVIVIALRQPNRSSILARLEWILSHVGNHQFNNRVFQLRDSTWLAYPPIAD